MSFCILIPTINRKDLLDEALKYYSKAYPSTFVIVLDNGNQGFETDPFSNYHIWSPPDGINLGVAGSWNFLIELAIFHYKIENFLILNDDIILQKDEGVINALIERWGKNTFHIPRSFYNWSAFLFSKSIWEKVGYFDDAFKKCFFEDNDYAYRLKLANVDIHISDELNAEVYRNSQTIEKDPSLGGYIENREYYIRKWGGLPTEETFKTPFNE